MQQLGLEGEAKVLGTPGERAAVEEEEQELETSEATKYRAVLARGLYLSQDRSDI